MIEIRNLEKFYESGAGKTFVLRRISLDIKQGDFVTIMGPSGAGKSTLLAILGMLDSNWQGEYYFLSEAVHKMKPKDRVELNKRSIGFRLSERKTSIRTSSPAGSSSSSRSLAR